MRSQEMAGKILSVCVQEHVKDSQRDHEEGEPLATRRAWLIEPGTRRSKYGYNHSL